MDINGKTIAIIMARGGSKGLPRKNVRLLNGKPLIAYSIEDAINSGVCDTVLVTSEDDEINKVSKEYGATVSFKRPSDLAGDSVPPEPVIQHALKEHEKIGLRIKKDYFEPVSKDSVLDFLSLNG